MKRLLLLLVFSLAWPSLYLRADAKEEQVRDQRQGAPKLFADILEAPEVELLSIDPGDHLSGKKSAEESPKKPRVDGYLINKRVTVRDRQQIKALALSLRHGIEQSGGDTALCFNPRHALRVARPSGDDLIVIVSFECLQGYVTGFSALDSFTTTKAPEAEWKRIFGENGL